MGNKKADLQFWHFAQVALRAPQVRGEVLCAAVAVNEPDSVEVVHEAAGHLLQPAQHLLSLAPGPGQQTLVVTVLIPDM